MFVELVYLDLRVDPIEFFFRLRINIAILLIVLVSEVLLEFGDFRFAQVCCPALYWVFYGTDHQLVNLVVELDRGDVTHVPVLLLYFFLLDFFALALLKDLSVHKVEPPLTCRQTIICTVMARLWRRKIYVMVILSDLFSVFEYWNC